MFKQMYNLKQRIPVDRKLSHQYLSCTTLAADGKTTRSSFVVRQMLSQYQLISLLIIHCTLPHSPQMIKP